MRVLLIEDDELLRITLTEKFAEKHFAVDSCANGVYGYENALTYPYDSIIIDYALPGKNGFECCRDIKMHSSHNATTPIIMATAATSTHHTLLGFSFGADDYIPKPFHFDELYARMRTLLRRSHQKDTVLSFDTLCVDTVSQIVTRGNQIISLTRTEYQLLEVLLLNQKMVVSRAMLIERIWDNGYNPNTNSIETHIFNLRKKIELPHESRIIFSIPYRGYKIDTEK